MDPSKVNQSYDFSNSVLRRGFLKCMYICMFSTADLEIRNAPFPNSDLPEGCLWFALILGLTGFCLKT